MLDQTEVAESLIRRYRALGADKAEIDGEMAEIKNQLDAITDVGWKLTVDGLTASKRMPNRVFDPSIAVTLLDAETKQLCVTTSYDPKKLRQAVEALGLIDDAMTDRPDAATVLKL